MRKILFTLVLSLLLMPVLLLGEYGDTKKNEASVDTVRLASAEAGSPILISAVKYGTAPHAGASSSASDIADWFYSTLDMDVEVYPAKTSVGDDGYATYGVIDSVPLTLDLASEVDAAGTDGYAWGIAYRDGILAFYANSKIAFSDPEGLFHSLFDSLPEYVSNDAFCLPDGFIRVEKISKMEYTALVEEKREMEKQEKINEIKNKIETEFSDSTFDPNGLGITEDMTKESGKSYSAPSVYPEIGTHPRVLFTADMIPGIKAALEDETYAAAYDAFEKLLKTETDGRLGNVVTTATYSSNFSGEVLNVIQAKAFAYAVYGDEYYGYTAIYALLNFMATLDYNFKQIDQTRDFGAIIYTAACVYDWCYDLLSDATMRQILLGVEHVACRGYVDEPEKASFEGVKLEIGFPPAKQGAVTGHGCEMMILRNFLAISIAIYDEHPGWYEFCAGRFFDEYIEPRNLYYSAGMYPQGTQYNSQRFLCDLYSAAFIKAISGKIPYNESDMRNTVYGLFATVSGVEGRETFFVGDIRRTNTQVLPRTGECAMIASYLFDDPILRGIAQWRENGFSKFTSGVEALTPTEFFAFASNGIGISENGILDVPSVIYNGGWYGQISVREAWRDEAAVVLMKIQERTTANHDHAAAGTFQIYYKGILTGDMGDYAGDVYGDAHCKYFLRSTVAHNGILIYDASKKDTLEGYYVGGQRIGISEASTLESWKNNMSYDTGEVTGYAYGYRTDGDTEYAYIAGDITKAYDSSQATFVGRSMLTVYTGDDTVPMVFFVFDRINSASSDFEKKFLLQVPTSQAPVIDENAKTVEVNNGEGKLLLTNIIGADDFVPLGGTDKNGNRLNYQINGKQVDFATQGVVTNRDSWGRVELVQNTGSTLGNFFNVICVGDSDADIDLLPIGFAAYSGEDGSERILEGARAGDTAALFVNSEKRTSVESVFTIPGEGLVSTYVCGLFTGSWRVSIDGQSVGTVYSTYNSGMVKFTVPAGAEITLTPGEDVRPSNSGEITYVTGGATFGTPPSQFYTLGVTTALPTDIKRGSDIFVGWYTDPAFTNKITEIPEDAEEKMTVYAKWVSVPFCEDFGQTEINDTVDTTLNGARYSCDKKVSSSFVTDSYRGSLIWTAGAAGPHITVNSSTLGSSSNLIASMQSTSVTYSLSLSLNANQTPQDLLIRIRDNGSLGAQQSIMVATLKNGVLKLGSSGEEIFSLTTSMQTANITVDFAACTLTVKDAEGRVIAEEAFKLPATENGMTGLEWKKLFTTELLNIRSNSGGSLLVGRIAVVEGDKMFLPDEPISNRVVYVTDGGAFADEPSVDYTPGEEKQLDCDISKDGFVFLGWYTSPDFSGEPITVLPDYANGEFPVYAKWASHKINYVTDGGAFADEPSVDYTPGEEKPLDLTVSKDGYNFCGWFTTPDFSGEPLEALPTDAFDVFTVYAKWELLGNVVVYNPNGGELLGVSAIETGELAETYVPDGGYVLKTTVSKTNCEFLGWYTASGERIETIPEGREGAIYVTAIWRTSFVSEDYSETVIDTDSRVSENGISYSFDNKEGSSFVTDAEGEYLTFDAKAAGPHLTANAGANSYSDMDSGILSITLSISKNGSNAPMDFRFRIRDKGGCTAGSECELVILYCSSGTLYLGNERKSVKLFELTEDFTDVMILVDFEAFKLFAYSDAGSVVAEVDMLSSSLHPGVDGEEWRAMFENELFNLRAMSAGSIKISKISITEGNFFEK